jgi:hypothetical protein
LILFDCVQYVQFYFFYLKEQETAKKGGKQKEKEAAVQDTAVVQNIHHSTSLPMEEMSEPYMAITTFSQILTVIFQTNTPFFYTIHGHQYILPIVHPNLLFCRGQSQMMLLLISSSIDCLRE